MSLAIKVNDLSMAYADGIEVLRGFTHSFEAGSFTAIVGPSGCGKSSLLRILAGLQSPSSGKIETKPYTSIGYVFQEPTLLAGTVRENIRLGFPTATDEALLEAATFGGIRSYFDQHPQGFDFQIGERGVFLSGGQRQGIALARAMLNQAELLLLDEPTANLDPTSISVIENIVKNASDSNVKVIFVTHDIRQARRLGSDIIFFHNGQVTEHTDTKIFFDKPFSREAKAFLDGEIMID